MWRDVTNLPSRPKRTIVYGESHRHCRFVDGYAGEASVFQHRYGIHDFESFESDDAQMSPLPTSCTRFALPFLSKVCSFLIRWAYEPSRRHKAISITSRTVPSCTRPMLCGRHILRNLSDVTSIWCRTFKSGWVRSIRLWRRSKGRSCRSVCRNPYSSSLVWRNR